ncbi:glycerate kinase [Actinotalea sp. Marseille-Q4924]|uniref:glycerate kinase n=1 Tax=Actinotalea sp. Marseille-Q4924 TaxID=2866571 RepID=UPI001CE3DEEF|nr:glycerate kinase [Actinotalea sp. Marseille-Q4924]
MRILVAPDRFADALSAAQAAEVMAAGWAAAAPDDALVRLPLSDGGPGFTEAVRAVRGGEVLPVTVAGPDGADVPVPVLVHDDADGPTAYLEAALVLGPHLLAGVEDPSVTSSYGLGQALRAVLDHGIRRVVVAVGGVATHDGGAGVLAGLGLAAPALRRGGAALSGLSAADLDGLAELRRELASVHLVGAVDSDVQLLGLHGTSAALASARRVKQDEGQDLERALSALAHLVGEVVAGDAFRRDLLVPAGDGREHTRRLAQLPGAGAGGGLGFVVAALGGVLRPGAHVGAETAGLHGRLDDADLVLTGERALDGHSLHDGVVATVAAAALRRAVPVVAVAGEVHVGRREWGAAGVSGVYAVAERPGEVLSRDGGEVARALRARVERVARTWSR